MRRFNRISKTLASLLVGGTLFGGGCQDYRDLIWPSTRDGLFTYISGSVTNSVDSAMFSDFITNSFLGGFTNGEEE